MHPKTVIGSPEYVPSRTEDGESGRSGNNSLNVDSDIKEGPTPVSISMQMGWLSTVTCTLTASLLEPRLCKKYSSRRKIIRFS